MRKNPNYIEREGEVLLLHNTSAGKNYSIQYGGIACLAYEARGKGVKRFVSKYRYFNPNFWYNRMYWLDDIGYIAFFKNKKDSNLFFSEYCKLNTPPEKVKEGIALLLKNAIETDCVLKAILQYASKKMKVDLRFDGFASSFGDNWWEALIPVSCDGKPGYILTWENCD